MAGLVAILHRYAQRAWFLKTRPDRSNGEGLEDAPESVRAAAMAARAGRFRAAEGAADSGSGAGTEGSLTAGEPEEAPLVAEARRFATRGYGARATTPLRHAIGIGSDVTISDAAGNDGDDGGWPASLSPRARPSAEPLSSRRPQGTTGEPIASVLPWSDGGGASVAPEGAPSPGSRGSSFSPAPSIAPGSKEAAERGRALKLLSEHDSRRDEGSFRAPWQRARSEAEPGVSLLAPARLSFAAEAASPKSGNTLLGAGPVPRDVATHIVDGTERRESRLPIDSTRIAEAVIFASEGPPGRRPSEGPPPSGRRASQRPSAGPVRNTNALPESRRGVEPARFPSIGPGGGGSSANASAAPEAAPGQEVRAEESASPLESGIVPAESPALQVRTAPEPEPREPWRNLLGSTGTADGW